MSERVDVQFVDYYAPLDVWTDVRANLTPDGGIAVWFRDVSREVQINAALAQRAEFEEQLIGIVSHDLRTPLNAILLASELLSELDELSEPAARTVARIQSAAEGATRLVRDLLDFTQARLGAVSTSSRAPRTGTRWCAPRSRSRAPRRAATASRCSRRAKARANGIPTASPR